MSDVYYLTVFLTLFITLGIIAPLLDAEFSSDIDEGGYDSPSIDEPSSQLSTLTILLNMITIPFWTFGLPVWFNLSILLILRLAFIFVIARNIWVGGGG